RHEPVGGSTAPRVSGLRRTGRAHPVYALGRMGARQPRRLAVGTLAILVAAVVSSCAASSRQEDPRQWRARANAVCDQWDHAVHKLGSATTFPRVASVARDAAALANRYVKRLRELPPPTGHTRDARRMLRALDELAPALERLASA